MLEAAHTLCPDKYSCRTLRINHSRLVLSAFLSVIVVGIALFPLFWLGLFLLWAGANNMVMAVYRVRALLALRHESPVLPEFLTPKLDSSLPKLTLLVPLFHEENSLPGLLAALNALDYPTESLEIHLLIEEIDTQTAQALQNLTLPAHIRALCVPRDWLQTKPKALNFALPFCRGEIVGIYDAEDRPEPDQLQNVVRKFNQMPPDVACLQGQLDYYNTSQSWIARCFTIEYATWFRVVMHGVAAINLPIPLGGTTLFIRRAALDKIGGWDAHNVTEDADLGIRLHRFGYRTRIITTTTWEEASATPSRWIRQRSRWLKGFAMTWASQMRAPYQLWADLGTGGFLAVQVLLLAGLGGFLAAPIYAMLWAMVFGLPIFNPDALPLSLRVFFSTGLIAGQITNFAVMVRATKGRRWLLTSFPSLVFYWPMASIAAYKAMAELIFAPYYWDKTSHGMIQPKLNLAPPSAPIATSSVAFA